MADNNWLDIKGYANLWSFKTENSEGLLKRIIETLSDDGELVMDFFLGSGTTAAVAHKMRRKWIGVEMGDQFKTVAFRRLCLVLNGDSKGISSDVNWDGGGCFKYMRLESYEDALNNLTLEDRSADLLDVPDNVAADYLLRYSLEVEMRKSLLCLKRFEDPLNCTLKIYDHATGEAKPTVVDLPETFNYLLGLRVRTLQMRDGFLVIEGENPAAETVLVIWRNVKDKDNAALEQFVTATLRINPADTEYAAIYINGDTTLDDPHKKILLTEQVFHELMFDIKSL